MPLSVYLWDDLCDPVFDGVGLACFKSRAYADGGSKWTAGTRETEVGLDGWCEGGLGQQRNDGGGCVSMREISDRMECLGTYVSE